MMGRRPYPGIHRKEYREKIASTEVQIRRGDQPENWSDDARDIINKLLQRKEDVRLGSKGAQSVKDHPWFKDIVWEDILEQRASPPFIPPSVSLFIYL
jgi:protein kinase A